MTEAVADAAESRKDDSPPRYLYVAPTADRAGVFQDARLDRMKERHRLGLADIPTKPFASTNDFLARLEKEDIDGVVFGFELGPGYLTRPQMKLARGSLTRGKEVYVHWPQESAIERVDQERYRSFRRLWLAAQLHDFVWRPVRNLPRRMRAAARGSTKLVLFLITKPKRFFVSMAQMAKYVLLHGVPEEMQTGVSFQRIKRAMREADELGVDAAAVPFELDDVPSSLRPLSGAGLYLRTDYWAKITSGGSYGHTCYVARSLDRATERFFCLMAQPFPLLDELGVDQLILEAPGHWAAEDDIVTATLHYAEIVRRYMRLARPKYIYERLALGNFAGAQMSREFGVPYFVEYNGSEISMRKSFDGHGYKYESFYLRAEEVAFKQATVISVVSEPIKEDLVGRGVPEEKILVNPNGADPRQYAPASPEEKLQIREELGLADRDLVIGFTGTFGGWHGIDVLAEGIPRILNQVPEATFLLIGDGNYKYQVDFAVKKHRIRERVRMTGRVPQQQGARLLRACDIYVSPHSRHMVDSRFFGSPTKIFEYMALGQGIVASDLEQIGEVLSPALRPRDFDAGTPTVSDERAVLCTPGDVDEFVDATVALARHPELAATLGANARQAILDHYSWDRHVEKLWEFAIERSRQIEQNERAPVGEATAVAMNMPDGVRKEGPDVVAMAAAAVTRLVTTESGAAEDNASDRDFKRQAQSQWDQDPCGSHYVHESEPRTLEWFKKAEEYRYGEYAPWMLDVMEFDQHSGHSVLEVGAGMGTDLARFASNGAVVTDFDLSLGHLALARRNFELRGLSCRFVYGDAEGLPFPDDTFDVIYSNGVIHHIPNSHRVVDEIHRVLKPGGKAMVMVYAENSRHYWLELVRNYGLKRELLQTYSMGEIMSQHVEISENDARPLVKVYTRERLRRLFHVFDDAMILQRQLTNAEIPKPLRWIPRSVAEKHVGWNLIIKATKSP